MPCYEDEATYTFPTGAVACVPLDSPQAEHDAAAQAGGVRSEWDCHTDGNTLCGPTPPPAEHCGLQGDLYRCDGPQRPEPLPTCDPATLTPGQVCQGAPAVPIGFEAKYGGAGFTIEPGEAVTATALPAQMPHTGAQVSLEAGAGSLILAAGLVLAALSRKMRRA